MVRLPPTSAITCLPLTTAPFSVVSPPEVRVTALPAVLSIDTPTPVSVAPAVKLDS